MKKLSTVFGTMAIMAMMVTPAFAATQDVLGGDGAGTTEFNNTTAAPFDVYATTSQTDAYKATIGWGDMTFDYHFGTWDPVNKVWTGEAWQSDGFNGTKDKIAVTNYSSQPLDATFAYVADVTKGDTTAGTFRTASGGEGTEISTMALALCPVSPGTVPTADAFLALTGRPATDIGTSAAKIGTITVTLDTNDTAKEAAAAVATAAAAVFTGYTTTVFVGDVITLPDTTANTQTAVEAKLITAAAASGYTVGIAEGSTYTGINTTSGTWVGRFTITKDSTTWVDAVRTITVTVTP